MQVKCSTKNSRVLLHELSICQEKTLITPELSYKYPADLYIRPKKIPFTFFFLCNNRIPYSCLKHIHSKWVCLPQMLSVSDVGYYTEYYLSPQRPNLGPRNCMCVLCLYVRPNLCVVCLFKFGIFMLMWAELPAICLSGILFLNLNQAKVWCKLPTINSQA